MNFNTEKSPFNMPELDWYWGYVACWAIMLATALSLVFFFWKRGWFESLSTAPQVEPSAKKSPKSLLRR